MEGSGRSDVHIALEQLDEIEPKPGQIEKGAPVFKFHQEVHIALGRVLSSGYRSKNARAHHSPAPHEAFHFGPMFQE